MVFAAGYGLRLRPLTEKIPKALVPVAGRPMIEYPLMLLRHYGIDEVIINLHHLGSMIEAHIGDGKKLGLKISYSWEKELLDTGGGLLQAKPYLKDGTFLVINSDVLIDLPLSDLIAFHSQKKATATLALRSDEMAERYGSIACGPDGKIHRFLKARLPGPPPTPAADFMFTGVQILEPRVFDYMQDDGGVRKPFGTTKDTYPKMLIAGEPLYGFTFDGFWQDLGTRERIKEVEEMIRTGKGKLHYATIQEEDSDS